MKAEKMRHRITLQQRPERKGPLGSYEEDWADVATVWAQISPVSGREAFGQIRETTVTHKLYCRYHGNISPRMRVLFGTRTFRIISVLNWDDRNQGMTLMCEELVQ